MRTLTISLFLFLPLTLTSMDTPFGFRSKGIDLYSDGSVVRDGECYALVWSKSEFSGFKKDGTSVDNDDDILYIIPFAKDGKCPPVNFLIPEDYANDHKDGKYNVVVLDTRGSDKIPVGIDENGKLIRVNGWSYANNVFYSKSLQGISHFNSLEIGTIIETKTKNPENVGHPVITLFEMDECKNSIVEFTNAVRYLSYGLKYGTSLDELNKMSVDVQDGKDGINILILTNIETYEMNPLFMKITEVDIDTIK